MDINEDTITDAISELFRYRVPKRLAEYWNEQYAGSISPTYIKNWADLSGVLQSEYDVYAIGIRDNEKQHEIICSQCFAANKYAMKTGYQLKLLSYEVPHDHQAR